jgi:hypothetical protein
LRFFEVGLFDALDLGDETRLDGQELPSLANHFMLNRNLPNCTEIPAPSGRKDCKEKGVPSAATP